MSDDKDQVIRAAIRDQKIRASQADDFRRLWDTNPAVYRNLLTAPVSAGGLAPGIVPAEDPEAISGYDDSMLTPKERARIAQVRAAAVPVPPAPVAAGAAGPSGDAYDESMLSPAERSRIAAIKAGTYEHPRVQMEEPGRAAA